MIVTIYPKKRDDSLGERLRISAAAIRVAAIIGRIANAVNSGTVGLAEEDGRPVGVTRLEGFGD